MTDIYFYNSIDKYFFHNSPGILAYQTGFSCISDWGFLNIRLDYLAYQIGFSCISDRVFLHIRPVFLVIRLDLLAYQTWFSCMSDRTGFTCISDHVFLHIRTVFFSHIRTAFFSHIRSNIVAKYSAFINRNIKSVSLIIFKRKRKMNFLYLYNRYCWIFPALGWCFCSISVLLIKQCPSFLENPICTGYLY